MVKVILVVVGLLVGYVMVVQAEEHLKKCQTELKIVSEYVQVVKQREEADLLTALANKNNAEELHKELTKVKKELAKVKKEKDNNEEVK